jgi:hypothetical protein
VAEVERRQLTVVFCDLVGSIDLSTRLGQAALADGCGDGRLGYAKRNMQVCTPAFSLELERCPIELNRR